MELSEKIELVPRGAWLATLRHSVNATQQDVAEWLDIRLDTWVKWENCTNYRVLNGGCKIRAPKDTGWILKRFEDIEDLSSKMQDWCYQQLLANDGALKVPENAKDFRINWPEWYEAGASLEMFRGAAGRAANSYHRTTGNYAELYS